MGWTEKINSEIRRAKTHVSKCQNQLIKLHLKVQRKPVQNLEHICEILVSIMCVQKTSHCILD